MLSAVVEPLCDVPRSVRSWARNVSQFCTSRSEFQLQGIIKVLKLFSGTFPAEFNFEMWRGHDPGIKHTYARESLLLLRDSNTGCLWVVDIRRYLMTSCWALRDTFTNNYQLKWAEK